MNHIISERSIVLAVKEQISSDLGGEVAILDLDAGMYYGLDEVGARIWELVQEPTRVSAITTTIVEEYDVESNRAAGDVLALLQQLADERLIEVENEPIR